MDFYIKPSLVKLTFAIILILYSLSGSRISSEGINTLIKTFCLESFNEEIAGTNKEINSSVGNYTCNCFIEKLNEGHRMDNAKEICREDATTKFSL